MSENRKPAADGIFWLTLYIEFLSGFRCVLASCSWDNKLNTRLNSTQQLACPLRYWN